MAGRGTRGDGGDGGPGIEAQLNGPHHVAVPAEGRLLYIADTGNNRVRTLDPETGIIRSVAGTGEKSFGGDGGPAAAAHFNGIYCVDFDRSGKQLYAVDLNNRRIRVIDLQSGMVSTVAGNGEKGVPTDGAEAKNSPLFDPRAVAVDSKGQVYIVERNGNALRVVGTDGRIRTVAGTGDKGYAGDGGDARSALLNGPKHLTVDRDDTVLIVDTENHAIRRYNPTDGKITLVAGTGKAGSGGLGGPPEKLELNRPHGVYVEKNGDLILSDSENHRVVKMARRDTKRRRRHGAPRRRRRPRPRRESGRSRRTRGPAPTPAGSANPAGRRQGAGSSPGGAGPRP